MKSCGLMALAIGALAWTLYASERPDTLFRDVQVGTGAAVNVSWAKGTGRASTSLPLLPDGHTAVSPAWCISSDGSLVVVWEETSRDGADADITAQKVRPDGKTAWSAAGVAVNAFRGRQQHPRVSPTDDGGVYVVWQSDSAGRDNVNIWCQRLRADGSWAWTDTPTPVCTFPKNQVSPDIATDLDGAALIVWVDYRNGNADIYGQRLERDATPFAAEDGIAIEVAPGDQTNVRFEYDRKGNATSVAWDETRAGFSQPVKVKTDISRLPIPEPGSLAVAAIAAFLMRRLRVPRA